MATSETSEADPPSGKEKRPREKRGVPSGLWLRCDDCGQMIYRKESEKIFNVCPECDFHMYLGAQGRIQSVLDDGTFQEWDAELSPIDPLEFQDKKKYSERLLAEQQRTGLRDAVLTGSGMIRRGAWRLASPTVRSSWAAWARSWASGSRALSNGPRSNGCH